MGEVDQLAPEEEQYPMFRWETKLKTVKIEEDGLYAFMPEDNLTARFGAAVTMNNIRFEIWDGSRFVEE